MQTAKICNSNLIYSIFIFFGLKIIIVIHKIFVIIITSVQSCMNNENLKRKAFDLFYARFSNTKRKYKLCNYYPIWFFYIQILISVQIFKFLLITIYQ